MTQLEFLLDQIKYCNKWMATDIADLPGTLTHDKVARLAIETECKLIDFVRLGGDNEIFYFDPESLKRYPITERLAT